MNTYNKKSQDKFEKLEKLEKILDNLNQSTQLLKEFLNDPHSELKGIPVNVLKYYRIQFKEEINNMDDINVLLNKVADVLKEAKDNGGISDVTHYFTGEF